MLREHLFIPIQMKPPHWLEAEVIYVTRQRREGLFLGALAKLRKVTISLHMPVCLSVCPSAWNNSARLDGFSGNLIFDDFSRKSVKKIQVPLKSDKNCGYLTRRRT
jgi:hypothetical protein